MIATLMAALINLLQDQRPRQGMNHNGTGGPTPTMSYMSNIRQIANSLQHNIDIIIKELLSGSKYQTRELVAETLSYES